MMFASRLAAALLAVSLTAPAWSATLVLYPFSTDGSPTIVAPDVTPVLDRSTLLNSTVANDGFGNVLQAYSSANSAALALANGQYFTLSLSITPGVFANLVVNLQVGKGGNNDPRGYFVRSSLDGFTMDIFAAVLPNGAKQAPAPASFSVDAIGQTAIDLRFYTYAPSTGNSVDFRNLEVADGVPEPTTWALVATGLLSATLWRRRGNSSFGLRRHRPASTD
jgi:hypothetical protein